MTKMKMLFFTAVVVLAIIFITPFQAFAENRSFSVPISDLQLIPLGEGSIEGLTPAGEVTTQSSGAWSDVKVGPTLYQKGYWYYADFSPQIYVPSNATITLVSWQWGVYNYLSGLIVRLGYISGGYYYYIDISTWGRGTSTDFNGITANRTFRMYFYYPGSGVLNPPMYGQSDTVTVSWTTP